MTQAAQEMGNPQTQPGWTEVLTCAEMRALEARAIASGAVTGLELMERAGAAVADHIRQRWPNGARAIVLCGPGNNGGDGYVVARHLAEAGWQVTVLGMDNTPGPDAAEMKRRWAAMGRIEPLDMTALNAALPADLAVDALFGTGTSRRLDPALDALLNCIGGYTPSHRSVAVPVVAVDAPSGLCLDSGRMIGRQPGVLATRQVAATVTFHRPKVGHLIAEGPPYCGQLIVADIGLTGVPGPLHGIKIAAPDPRALAKYAPGHKFDHGACLVIAGEAGQGGAARLAARAALRVGAGLVTLGAPAAALSEHVGPPDALMRRPLDGDDELTALLRDTRFRAVAIGPGCGIARAGRLVDAVLSDARSVVLDADALTGLAKRGLDGLHPACVLTPHMGEFARLFPDLASRMSQPEPPEWSNQPARKVADMIALQHWRQALADQRGPLYSKLDAVRDAAARSGAVVLLKGPDTVIAAPDGQARIHSAYDVPWLATAGAGDVLAGIIAGLLARGLPPLDAAATGAFLHAQAARRFGPGLIADDLPDQLPGVFRDLGL